MRNLICVVLLALLAGCAQQGPVKLYSGPDRGVGQLLVVEVPEDLEVLTINGRQVASMDRMFRGDALQLHMDPGEYRIEAYYRRVFEIDGTTHEVIRSRAATFLINGKAGETWRLAYRQPRNLDEAREMSRRFDAWAENRKTGERIAAEQGAVPPSIATQLFGRSPDQEGQQADAVAPLNDRATPAARQPVAGNEPVTVVTPVAQPSPASLPHDDATLITLQQLWLLLGPESRRAFLDWAAE